MKINLNSKSKKRIILTGLIAAVVILIIAVCLFSLLKTSKSGEIAKEMLKEGIEREKIIKITGLTGEEIDKIKKE